MLHWDGIFSTMLISPGGAERPETFPPELPISTDAELHLRSLPHGVWAGVTLPWRSRRAPEYSSPTRGYCRIQLRRRQGGNEPSGYMGTSTSFVLFPWGKIRGGRPVKWLLHITGGPPTADPNATELRPGTSFTLEMPPGATTWQLGGLPPRLALQYYYDWGNFMGTGAIYGRLPRASNNPPTAWEQMAQQLIPSPRSYRQPAMNPTFDMGDPHEGPSPGEAPSGGPAPHPGPQPSPTPMAEHELDPQDEHDPAHDLAANEENDEEGDHAALMQTQLDSVASSSHEPARERPAGGQPHRMAPAAAMVRRWLRQVAALLQQQPMGDAIPLLLEETMQAVGTCTEDDRWQDDGTVGGPGLCKKRRILNYLYIARVRLQDVCDDEGANGLNQHQIYADLQEALGDLRRGQMQLEQATGGQGGHQVVQGSHGIQQAIAAVETAMGDTTNGDLDWVADGWGQAIGLLLQDAEDLLEEESILDYVHPANVVALDEGAHELPAMPTGGIDEQVDRLLRHARAVMHFVPAGGAQMRQLLAAVLVWRQRERGSSIEVDTQTTDAGEPPVTQPREQPEEKWIPPLNADQWTGSMPSSARSSSPTEGDRFEPTEDELLQALEEFEKREHEETLGQASGEVPESAADDAAGSEGKVSDTEHRRRRQLASLFDGQGNPEV